MANRLRDLHAVRTAAAFDAWSPVRKQSPLIQSVNHAGPAVGATIASTLCFSNVASMPSPRARVPRGTLRAEICPLAEVCLAEYDSPGLTQLAGHFFCHREHRELRGNILFSYLGALCVLCGFLDTDSHC